jgi:hypothetical protein
MRCLGSQHFPIVEGGIRGGCVRIGFALSQRCLPRCSQLGQLLVRQEAVLDHSRFLYIPASVDLAIGNWIVTRTYQCA